MIFGLLFQVVILVLVVLAIRKLRSGRGLAASHGESIRRLFQYAILFGLITIVGVGLSGLLTRAFARDLMYRDQTELARNFSYVVVGLPLYILGIFWTRGNYREDKAEAGSFGWAFYFTLTSLTSLISSLVALDQLLSWAIGSSEYRSSAVAQSIVWTLVWAVHWWANAKFTPPQNSRAHFLVGSLIGLAVGAFGLGGLLASLIRRTFNVGGDALFLSKIDSVTSTSILLGLGAVVWFIYWIRTSYSAVRDGMWLTYVLLAGVAGGLLVAVVSASTSLYSVLVWFIGQPGTDSASVHFKGIPSAGAAFAVGILIWWYHRDVLAQDEKEERTEASRIYQYLMAGIGLMAAAAGLVIILVALIQTITSSTTIAGEGSGNTLIAAGTLLIVGVPIWWDYWRKIQLFVAQNPTEEHLSPTRRIYLFVLFGIGGLTAVIALVTGVFFVFDDAFKDNFGLETLRRARFAIGLLLSIGAVAGYHWSVYRNEREEMAMVISGPRYILLVGPRDPEFARQLARKTGARVHSWERTDLVSAPWSLDSVVNSLGTADHDGSIVIADPSGPKVISVKRD